jgi:hypothetical protein
MRLDTAALVSHTDRRAVAFACLQQSARRSPRYRFARKGAVRLRAAMLCKHPGELPPRRWFPRSCRTAPWPVSAAGEMAGSRRSSGRAARARRRARARAVRGSADFGGHCNSSSASCSVGLAKASRLPPSRRSSPRRTSASCGRDRLMNGTISDVRGHAAGARSKPLAACRRGRPTRRRSARRAGRRTTDR